MATDADNLIAFDSFTASNWQALHNRVGEIGASWTRNSAFSGTWYTWANQVHCGIAGAVYASAIPDSADYDVECDYRIYSHIGSQAVAIRMATGQSTMYYVYYDSGAGMWTLGRRLNGVVNGIAWYPAGVTLNTAYKLRIQARGSTIDVKINDVLRISHTDTNISAAGRGGVVSGTVNDANTGKHIDNFRIFDLAAPASGETDITQIIGM